MQAEYQQNQIQAKKEGSDTTAGEEEDDRPPGEDDPANGGKDSVKNLHYNVIK